MERKPLMGQTRFLAALPLLSLLFGFLEYGPRQSPQSGSLTMTLHAVASLVVVFVWFRMDSRRLDYRPSIVLMAAMLALTFLALPYYLLRSRGAAGGIKALALSFLLFAVTMILYRVGTLFA